MASSASGPASPRRWPRPGIAFIGPPEKAIAAMGDKIESKKLAAKAGVTSSPATLATSPTTDDAVKIAKDVGYPVMMKASAWRRRQGHAPRL
jgi:propionyl-CoA carboxylase alpha chain